MSHYRVPMPSPVNVLADDDLTASISDKGKYGRRFSIDVAEDALADMGRQALPFVAQRLAERAVHEPSTAAAIQRTVDEYLNDRTWLAPIIEDEVRRCVRRYVFDLMTFTAPTP